MKITMNRLQAMGWNMMAKPIYGMQQTFYQLGWKVAQKQLLDAVDNKGIIAARKMKPDVLGEDEIDLIMGRNKLKDYSSLDVIMDHITGKNKTNHEGNAEPTHKRLNDKKIIADVQTLLFREILCFDDIKQGLPYAINDDRLRAIMLDNFKSLMKDYYTTKKVGDLIKVMDKFVGHPIAEARTELVGDTYDEIDYELALTSGYFDTSEGYLRYAHIDTGEENLPTI